MQLHRRRRSTCASSTARSARMPKAIGRTARGAGGRRCPTRSRPSASPRCENGLPTTTVTIDRSDLEAQVDRPNAGAQSWETTRARRRAAGRWRRARPGGATSIRCFSWAVIPVPTVQLFGGNDGFRPQLTAAVPRQRDASRRASRSRRMVRQPLLGVFDDPGRRPNPPATCRRCAAQSARYYSGWDPKLIRLTGDYLFKLNRDTYARASAGILERAFAGVSGEVLWKPVEQNWGLGARAQLRGAARLRQPVRLRLLRLRRGDRPRLALLGHRLVRHRDRSSPPAAISPATGAARSRCTRRFANGWAVGAYATKTDVTAEDFGEGSFDKGVTLSIPLRWTTPFETRQTHQRQPDLARERRRRVPRTSRTGSTRSCATRPRPAGAELGSVLAMSADPGPAVASRRWPPAAAAGANPIVQAAIEEVGGFWATRGRRPAAPPRRRSPAPTSSGPTSRRSRRGSSGDASPTLMYAAAVERRLRHLCLGAAQQIMTLRGGADHRHARARHRPAVGLDRARPTRWSRPIPPARWPARVRRSYELPAEGPQGRIVDLRLQLRAGGAGGDDHPAGALPRRADPRDLHRPDRQVREPALRRFVRRRLAQPAVGRAEDGPRRPARSSSPTPGTDPARSRAVRVAPAPPVVAAIGARSRRRKRKGATPRDAAPSRIAIGAAASRGSGEGRLEPSSSSRVVSSSSSSSSLEIA